MNKPFNPTPFVLFKEILCFSFCFPQLLTFCTFSMCFLQIVSGKVKLFSLYFSKQCNFQSQLQNYFCICSSILVFSEQKTYFMR